MLKSSVVSNARRSRRNLAALKASWDGHSCSARRWREAKAELDVMVQSPKLTTCNVETKRKHRTDGASRSTDGNPCEPADRYRQVHRQASNKDRRHGGDDPLGKSQSPARMRRPFGSNDEAEQSTDRTRGSREIQQEEDGPPARMAIRKGMIRLDIDSDKIDIQTTGDGRSRHAQNVG